VAAASTKKQPRKKPAFIEGRKEAAPDCASGDDMRTSLKLVLPAPKYSWMVELKAAAAPRSPLLSAQVYIDRIAQEHTAGAPKKKRKSAAVVDDDDDDNEVVEVDAQGRSLKKRKTATPATRKAPREPRAKKGKGKGKEKAAAAVANETVEEQGGDDFDAAYEEALAGLQDEASATTEQTGVEEADEDDGFDMVFQQALEELREGTQGGADRTGTGAVVDEEAELSSDADDDE